jgi:DNA-3-methyladenine glycosylase II
MTVPPAALAKAQRHLSRRDPVLKRLVRLVGPCTLWFEPDGFAALVRCIIAQQISTRAARSIHDRLAVALAPAGIVPSALLAASDEALRGAGLSAAKARSLRDLAGRIHGGDLALDRLQESSDEEVIARLVPVRGIGRWTAQMYLIFSLGRLDVLPTADLGLRVSVQRHYGLAEPPDRAALEDLARPWQPYRSIATWYFWRSLGSVPQSD